MLGRYDTLDLQCLPLDIGVYLTAGKGVLRLPEMILALAQRSHDTFAKVNDLLTVKSSLFAKDTKLSGFEILFGERNKSLTPTSFGIILGRLLEVSGWEKNIRAFDGHLGKLSTNAMLRASLDTFRPIPTLRQNVADLRVALQGATDSVGNADTTAFDELQEAMGRELISIHSVFEALLQRTDALSAKISNEVQLVIGSVTIQVCHTSMQHMMPSLTKPTGLRHDEARQSSSHSTDAVGCLLFAPHSGHRHFWHEHQRIRWRKSTFVLSVLCGAVRGGCGDRYFLRPLPIPPSCVSRTKKAQDSLAGESNPNPHPTAPV